MSRRKPHKLDRNMKEMLPREQDLIGSFKVGKFFEADLISKDKEGVNTYRWNQVGGHWDLISCKPLEDAPFEE